LTNFAYSKFWVHISVLCNLSIVGTSELNVRRLRIVDILILFYEYNTDMFLIVYLALCYPRGNGKNKTLLKLDFMSISLLSIGIASMMFHGTLRQTMQFVDDLSMFFLGGALIQALYAVNQTPAIKKLVAITVTLATTALSVVYVRSGDILLHTYIFMAMLNLIWPRTMFLIYAQGKSDEEKSRLRRRFWKSIIPLLVAYTLWHIDLEKCMELREFKSGLGIPWSWVFELHGWWHIGTAVGACEYIKLVRHMSDG
jgi:dihydroceramidase